MIKECIEIYDKKSRKYENDKLILDNYIPKDGMYVLIEIGEDGFEIIHQVEIRYDKRNDEIIGLTDLKYHDICFYDYCSKLIEMNKPIDSKKIIHTCNYLSFGLKQENLQIKKLSDDIIDGYYDILSNPKLKYNKKGAKELYEQVETSLGEPDTALIDRIRKWIKDNIYILPVEAKPKEYIKLFFIYPDDEKTKKMYENERLRYLLPNIYNSNEFNILVNGELMGLPNDNMGMNAKKPYLANKNRKVEVPYLLNMDDVVLQGKFFDYLMGQASKGRRLIYFDMKREEIQAYKPGKAPNSNMTGYVIYISKGKNGAEIYSADTVVDYNPNLRPSFKYKQIIRTKDPEDYGIIDKRSGLETIIDQVFFGKMLRNNYFTKPEDLPSKDGNMLYNMVMARDTLFTWFYKNSSIEVASILNQISKNLVLNSIEKGYWNKAQHQLNLRWSLMDYFDESNGMEEAMRTVRDDLKEHILKKDDWMFSSDEEFYFAVGQMVAFFLSKSRSKDKPLSFVNPFLHCKDVDKIKEMLRKLFKKYSHYISAYDYRAKQLFGNVMLYEPATVVNLDMLEAGFVSNSVIYIKDESKEKNNDKNVQEGK